MMRKDIVKKVTLLGAAGSGKTALFNRYVNPDESFNEKYRATPGPDFKTWVNQDTYLWDMGGQEMYKALALPFYRDTDIFLICIDLESLEGDVNKASAIVKQWHNEALEYGSKSPTFFLVGTKLDLVRNKNEAEEKLKKLNEQFNFAGYCMVSAKAKENLDELLEAVRSLLLSKVKNSQETNDRADLQLENVPENEEINKKIELLRQALENDSGLSSEKKHNLIADTNQLTQGIKSYYQNNDPPEVKTTLLVMLQRQAEAYQAKMLQLTGKQQIARYALIFVGAILGFVAGAIAGFMVGNIVGATAGAFIGAGVGAAVMGTAGGASASVGSRWYCFHANKKKLVRKEAYEYGQTVNEVVLSLSKGK